MPSPVGTGHWGRGPTWARFQDLVNDRFGLRLVSPDQCDKAPAIDQVDGRYVLADGA